MNILLWILFGLIIGTVTRHEYGEPVVGATILLLMHAHSEVSP